MPVDQGNPAPGRFEEDIGVVRQQDGRDVIRRALQSALEIGLQCRAVQNHLKTLGAIKGPDGSYRLPEEEENA